MHDSENSNWYVRFPWSLVFLWRIFAVLEIDKQLPECVYPARD